MSEPPLLVDREGTVVRLTLNRPAAGNAIDLSLAKALLQAAIECDSDSSVRCVVLTGAGSIFCSGGDLGSMAAEQERPKAFLSELAGTLHSAIARLARMEKPLLVIVNGPAAGAGMSLAILGDVVLAVDSAHFTTAYLSVGLTPDGGMSWLLPRLVGLRKAQEMILTNRRISASEAEAIGLVTAAVAKDKLMERGAAMALTLTNGPVAALGAARALLAESFGASLESHLEKEARAIASAAASSEGREGIAAYSEKRKPEFKDSSK